MYIKDTCTHQTCEYITWYAQYIHRQQDLPPTEASPAVRLFASVSAAQEGICGKVSSCSMSYQVRTYVINLELTPVQTHSMHCFNVTKKEWRKGVPSNRTLQAFTDPQWTISPQRNVNAAVQPPAGQNTVTAPKFICFHNQLCLILSSPCLTKHRTPHCAFPLQLLTQLRTTTPARVLSRN